MAAKHVPFQSIRMTKTFLTHIAFIRFLVRVNTHVDFQISSSTKTLLAHITFVRFLVRVNAHVHGQVGWIFKHLLANIALVLPSLSLPSLRRSLFFSQLLILLLNYFIKIDILITIFLIRYSQT